MLLLAVAAVFSACGDDDDDGGNGGGQETPANATADSGDDGGDDGGSVTFVEVDAADFSFDPSELNVAAGVELTFAVANTGAVAHTLTIYADEDYSEAVEGADTGNMPDGTVGEFTVTLDAGDYFFRCEVHPDQMQGTVTAE
jgi:plastocyanin